MEIMMKELGEIITGNTPSKKNEEFWNSEDICFVKPDIIADTGVNEIIDSNEYISEEARKKARVVGKGSIFVTCIGSIGKIGIASDGEYAFNQQINVIVPNEKVNSKYLAYNILYSRPRLLSIANAPVVPIINKSQFGEFVVNIEPNKNKQLEIVNILDKLTTVMSKRKDELVALDDLIKARFVELFGNPDINEKNWNVYKMEQLCEVGSSKRIYQNDQSLTGIPFLRISDLVNRMDTGSKDCDLFIPEELFEKFKKQGLVPARGDILLTARGTLGRCYIIQAGDEFYFQDGMITWLSKFDEKITPLYISYLFEMPEFRKQIDSLQAGSTVAYLSISMTKKLNVMVPPMELQNQFADFVHQVNKSKLLVQKSLDETQVLFNSLMQKYFG